ncbi:MAG: hypothetical protein L7F78_21685 [Syntrophales bacterium LBB04]|nr:hypothetical protein [Syntrophales bacterium LBB04]
MKIQIDAHTLERAAERGANESEIVDVINTGMTIDAKHGRIGKVKVFEFNRERHGRFYDQKRVEVFYGKWEA